MLTYTSLEELFDIYQCSKDNLIIPYYPPISPILYSVVINFH